MKESEFYNDDFEDFLREKSDQLKMYPSNKVWSNIYNSVHTRRRRFIAGMSLLITGILFIAGKELLLPTNHPTSSFKIISDNLSTDKKEDTKSTDSALSSSIAAFIEALKAPSTPRRLLSATEKRLAVNEDKDDNADDQLFLAPVISINTTINTITNNVTAPVVTKHETIAENSNSIGGKLAVENNNDDISRPVIHKTTESISTETKDVSAANPSVKENTSEDKNNDNWLEHKASYELKNTVKRGKLNWQVYVSPTGSFRTLSGGEPYAVPKAGLQYVPIALTHFGNPNDYVNQKPSVGFEAGGSILYRLTRNLSLKTGLQFNYMQYSIKAYTSPNSQQATISLNSFYGYNTNTITAYSNIQNFGGNAVKNLYNHYYQISIPVGFELRILGNEKLQLHIAADVQPTYLINKNSYLLTTDYSDYTKAPSLFRRWNINGGVETFLSYKVGDFRWQIGPEFRYQLLSTYTDQYPIKENLKSYGIKIGISKTIW